MRKVKSVVEFKLLFTHLRVISVIGIALIAVLGPYSLTASMESAAAPDGSAQTNTMRQPGSEDREETALVQAINALKKKNADAIPESPQSQLFPIQSANFAQFGYSVAIDGDTAVVGAASEGPGAVYIFTFDGVNWIEQQRISGQTLASSMFGVSVAIDGDTVVVGAWDSGNRIFVYTRNNGIWTRQQTLTMNGGIQASADHFGDTVAISGDTIIAGAPQQQGAVQVSASGAAYFFQRSGGVWTQVQRIPPPVVAENQFFGDSVAISGDYALIGYPRDAQSQGSVHVYQRFAGVWNYVQTLRPTDGPARGYFGHSVAIDGDTALVGAPYPPTTTGAAYVFRLDGAVWAQEASLLPSDGQAQDVFGWSVAISGDRVLVGAPGTNFTNPPGSTYYFQRCGTDWNFFEKFVAPAGAAGDQYGHGVAVSGSKAIIGVPKDDYASFVDPGTAFTIVIDDGPLLGVLCQSSIVVNESTDEPDEDVTDDICDIDESTPARECTLRAAIQTANAKAGPDRITFDIAGTGVQTISPGSTLPLIEETLAIDGKTQPGYAGSPVVQLQGGTGVNPGLGLTVGSDNSRISGLAIYGFETNIAAQSSGSVIESCFLGLKADGTAPGSGQQVFGLVLVNGAANNTIGGADIEDGNVIANLTVGVGLYGSSTLNQILNNRIGTNEAGDAINPNEVGIVINGSNGNRIGQAGNGNLISGSTFAGVYITGSSSTMVRSNKIGTNAAGTASLANLHGVAIQGGDNNKIGDITLDDANLISGNNGYGVVIYNSSANNRIINNSIGTIADGSSGLANSLVGVFIEGGANNNTVEKNVIGGHNTSETSAGIGFSADAGPENIIKGNFIGVARDGTSAIPNTYGIVNVSDGQIIGAQNEGNVIGHNQMAGILLVPAVPGPNPVVSNNTIQYNFVGTDGSADIGNNEFGILLEGTTTLNTVTRNIVSGNTGFGIALTDNVHNNTVKENFVGTNLAGDAAIPNGGGIWVRQARDNDIESNLVSGNSLGILVGTNIGFSSETVRNYKSRYQSENFGSEYTSGNRIFGNTVGLNAARTTAIPGTSIGIAVGENARDNVIGSSSGAYNLISGNTATIGYGIFLGTLVANPVEDSLPRSNLFQSNIIGLAGDLNTPVPNKVGFVLLQAINNTIAENVVVGSTTEGLQITDGSRENTIRDNRIGVLPSTQSPADSRLAGGPSAGNGGSGIKLFGRNVVSNQILNNLIGNNGGNGIEIECPDAPIGAEPQTLVAGNHIGVMLDNTGTALVNIRNALSGILIRNTANVQIGNIGANAGNSIGLNGQDGIRVIGNAPEVSPVPFSTRIINNGVGMIRNFSGDPVAAGNTLNGISADDVAGVLIGGDEAELANRVMANGAAGILLNSVRPTKVQPVAAVVKRNSIGGLLNGLGNTITGMANALGGIRIENSSGVVIGGDAGSEVGNLIASNAVAGVSFSNSATGDITGNTIIKNQGPGVYMYRSSFISIKQNAIGLLMNLDLPDSGNQGPGVLLEEAPGNSIGGSLVESFNQIGKNLQSAIHILNTHQNSNPFVDAGTVGPTVIEGNLVGGRTGSFGGVVTRASNAVGVLIENSSQVRIGGTVGSSGNSIVANSGFGIRLTGSLTNLVSITNNVIGKLAEHHGTASVPMGNGNDGISLGEGANGNTIGGDGMVPRQERAPEGSGLGNTITGNLSNGIKLDPTAGSNNYIANNIIFGNTGLGIDLGGGGSTPNDPLDADSGPNNLQNYPEILARQVVNNHLLITITIDSAPQYSNYGVNGILVRFYEADSVGQGQRLLGSAYYTLADYNGGSPIPKVVNLGDVNVLGISIDDPITATATDASGNTSEFTPSAPTSAGVSVSGRVITPEGNGLRNAFVTISDENGAARSVKTGSFGLFRFENVTVGTAYVITVSSKRYRFAPQLITVKDEVRDLTFVPEAGDLRNTPVIPPNP